MGDATPLLAFALTTLIIEGAVARNGMRIGFVVVPGTSLALAGIATWYALTNGR